MRSANDRDGDWHFDESGTGCGVTPRIEMGSSATESLLIRHECAGPMRARLRNATNDVHLRLHRLPPFAALVTGELTVSGYAALLGRMYGFHAPLERSLEAVFAAANGAPPYHITPVARANAFLLRTDLLDLGVSEAEADALPQCETLPSLATMEQRAGCLYVIEGARLGGAAMANALDYLLGSERRACRQFLSGQLDPDPMPWPHFCRWLEAMAEHADQSAIIASARHTFEAMEQWLSQDDGHV